MSHCMFINTSYVGARLYASVQEGGRDNRQVIIGEKYGLPYNHPNVFLAFLVDLSCDLNSATL